MEVEAKFRVPDEATLAELESIAMLAGCEVAAGERRHDADTFLDTPARDFLARGYYLRRRETTGGVRLTLKQLLSDEGGVLRREELEMLVAADVPVAEWPAGELRDRVEHIAAGRSIEAMLSLEQDRMARTVRRDGREVAELSLDRVTVRAGDEDHVWLETEVETRGDGTDEDLEALAAELRARWGLVPEPRAKFARALELIEAAPPAGAVEPQGGVDGSDADAAGRVLAASERPVHEVMAAAGGALARRAVALLALDDGERQTRAGVRAGLSERRVRYWLARYRRDGLAIYGDAAGAASGAAAGAASGAANGEEPSATGAPAAPATGKKRPDITRDDTMTQAAAATLRFHLAKMLEHEEGTRQGDDIEELHDMRVSTRRMRMALRVFAAYLDPDVMRPVLKGLRRTGRTLGAVRDLDVFQAKTHHYLDGLPQDRRGDLDGLLAAAAAERDRQREVMVRYLDSDRHRRFVERSLELLDGPVEHLAPPTPAAPRPERVAQVLPGVLYADMGVVWSFEGQLGGLETPLPRFHALRKACKGLRYTLEFFEDVLGPQARPLIKRVKGMQDHLGDLQDAVVTSGILRDYLTWGTWRDEDHELPGPVEIVVAPGAARYLAVRQEEMERLILTFPEAWPLVAGQEFSRDLAATIATI
jgi:CHAD domain-containing protein